MITRAGPAAGAAIEEGDVLTEVSGRPILVLQGEFPLYRSLTVGSRGPDVVELQAALNRLKLGSTLASGVFDGPMAQAVVALFERVGSQAPTDEAGAVTLRRGDVLMLPSLPVVVVTSPALGSEWTLPDQLQLDAGQLAVDSLVPEASAKAVGVGGSATIIDELGAAEFPGTITAVGTEVSSDASGRSGRRMTITPDRPLPPSLRNSNVRVVITLSSTSQEVFVVPFSALRSGPDGSTSVTVAEGGAQRSVTVSVGLSANGYVEVTPISGSLGEGDPLIVGSGPT